MSENINSTTPFSSGDHRWVWGPRGQAVKSYGIVGTDGEAEDTLSMGARDGVVEGVLVASNASRSGADTALSALLSALETLAEGGPYAWEDDMANTGSYLKIRPPELLGPRLYGRSGASVVVWQQVRVRVRELDGKPWG